MVELTYGGTWLKWSSLDRVDRNWAIASFATAALAAIPLSLTTADWGFAIGYGAASGHMPDSTPLTPLLESGGYAVAMLASVALALVSGFTWWRFSRNQDEMFNTIQNYAIAQAGGWTFAFVFLWWLLALGGWVGTLPVAAIVGIGVALLLGFWFQAVRRWA
jgi:putative flippase GtrA